MMQVVYNYIGYMYTCNYHQVNLYILMYYLCVTVIQLKGI